VAHSRREVGSKTFHWWFLFTRRRVVMYMRRSPRAMIGIQRGRSAAPRLCRQ